MFTFKNVVAVGLFLFGTTFVWMTRAFLADRTNAEGPIWAVVQALVLVAMAGFTLAAWGVFKQTDWWEAVAVLSAAVGLACVVPYYVAVDQLGQKDPGVGMNVAIHVFGSVAVGAVVLIPVVHTWVERRL
jgi:hypothetical protein